MYSSGLSGVVSAVAPLLALGVDVHPSGRLCLAEGPNTQAVDHASCRLLLLAGGRGYRPRKPLWGNTRAQLISTK